MADYSILETKRLPFTRGVFVQRVYDRLSPDFIVHNWTRTYVRALKADRPPMLTTIKRAMRLPLVRRVYPSEE
jgi:hypothetical protein